MDDFIPCTLRQLPADMEIAAAQSAIEINPVNAPARMAFMFAKVMASELFGGIARYFEPKHDEPDILPPQSLAVLTSRYWGNKGVTLSVSFMEQQPDDLKRRIVEHLNAWNANGANVKFALTNGTGQVRISLGRGGYWSYLGTDVLQISTREQTMNLEGFTMGSPDSEFRRVVRHEAGHTLGFPHEHMRTALVNRLDANKTIAYFRQVAGWSAGTTRQQVLTPLPESQLIATPEADQDSSMCYQLPGSITIDGQPIRGGNDINARDYAFIQEIYPGVVAPPPPPPPPAKGKATVQISIDWDARKWDAREVA